MNLTQIKQKLLTKNPHLGKNKQQCIQKEKKASDQAKQSHVKLIGITGSRGKSTTAYLVHAYLKSLGYKALLYSSIAIDAKMGYYPQNEASETPVYHDEILYQIIEEAERDDVDYIVLEVNETILEKGLMKDMPFTIRALTNINPKHNDEQYGSDDYVKLKYSFFQDIPNPDTCTRVIGLTDSMTKDEFDTIKALHYAPTYTYSSQYLCRVKNVDYNAVDVLLYEMDNSIEGLQFKLKVDGTTSEVSTHLLMNYNAMNMTCAIAILQALGVYQTHLFNQCVRDIQIPGRMEVIKAKGRTIAIDLFLNPALETFCALQKKGQINQIRVVTGAIGTGFQYWNDMFKTDQFVSKRHEARQFAMDIVKQYADIAYLTENDQAAESVLDICQELQGYLGELPSYIITDRKEAIRKAIEDSAENDLILITGRGNKRTLCDSATTMKIIKDAEIVKHILKEKGW
ncbi:MAG: Mur ligase family protein [Anaeroplasma bactoclasticum]|nr:Mur ligase family protein [Anaeroplasma bactoclasticum]